MSVLRDAPLKLTSRAVIYARVSTDAQDAANQLFALKSWCKMRGFEIVEVYRENETAWKIGHQREWNRLLTDARKHKFNIVVVWALDRISRQGPLTILQFFATLAAYKVQVVSYQESWTELPGPARELMLSITAWVARFESERRSERTKAALARLKKAGKTLGRPIGSKDSRRRKRRRNVYV